MPDYMGLPFGFLPVVNQQVAAPVNDPVNASVNAPPSDMGSAAPISFLNDKYFQVNSPAAEAANAATKLAAVQPLLDKGATPIYGTKTIQYGGNRGSVEETDYSAPVGYQLNLPDNKVAIYNTLGSLTSTIDTRQSGGFLNDFFGGISNSLADLDSSLKLSENAPIIAAIGIGVLTAGAGTALGSSMMNAGLLTSAEAASAAAALVPGATAASIAAAGTAATATATAVGTAVVSAGVQVAQGKPLDQALGSAATSLLTSQVISPAIASEVKSVISSPLVASTVTNMGTSLASGVLTGKTEDQILTSVLQAGAGTVVNSVAKDIVKNTPGLNDPSLPPEAKQIALAGIVGAIATGDGTKSMVNAAISVGTKALMENFSDVLKPTVVATLQDTHDTATADNPQVAGDAYANFVNQLSGPTTGPAEDFAVGPPVPGAAPFDDVGPVFQAPGTSQTASITDDVNTLIGQGVDPNLALSMALEWQAPVTGMAGGEQTAAADTGVVSDAGTEAPYRVDVAAPYQGTLPSELAALIPAGYTIAPYGEDPNAVLHYFEDGSAAWVIPDTSTLAPGAGTGGGGAHLNGGDPTGGLDTLAPDTGVDTGVDTELGGLDVLNMGTSTGDQPSQDTGAVVSVDPDTGDATVVTAAGDTAVVSTDGTAQVGDVVDTGTGDVISSGPSVDTGVSSNEAIASGMGPGSVGAQEAVTGDFTDAELAGATGIDTSGLDALTTGTTSNNEAIASGMGPGSVGAQEAVTGGLTDAELAGATGTDTDVAIPDYTDDLYASEDQDPDYFREQTGVDGVTELDPVTVTAPRDELLPLVDMGETTSTPIPEVVATTPAVVTPPVVIPPIVRPPVVTPRTTTPATGALPTTSYTDQTAPVGRYATVGKMGYEMPQNKLKQLYESLIPASDSGYNYVDDTNPDMLDIAKMNMSPYATAPMYAHGGLVHLAEGGEADVMKALKQLGEVGSEVKPSKHDLRQVGQMGAPVAPYAPKVLPQLAALLQARGMKLAEGGQPDDHTHPNYDGVPLLRTGGLSGLGGKYVEGKGDGTSDDIAAMLANGEYVFSADVVAALGNGSNKAGAEELDKMVQAIRARARSAPPDKLPPDAKSPLEYLKSSKGKK